MTPNDEAKADFASLEAAAQWYATLYAKGSTGAERRAWEQWLAQRPEHRQAWQHIEAVSARFAPLRGEGVREAAAAAVGAATSTDLERRLVLRGLAAFAGVGLFAWLGWRYSPLPELIMAWRSDFSTGIGERRDLQLADGTRVWLNTRSALDVAYDTSQRLLTLAMGEILIDTAKDDLRRPFFVRTGFGSMQALGTRFNVRQTPTHTLLAVFEGSVSIRNAAGEVQRVTAGQQRQFTATAIAPALPADPMREAWTRGVVLADNIPLGALVEELGRYRQGHLGVAPEVAGMTVVGRFPIDDPDHALAMLERDLPVRVRHTLPWWTSIEPR